LGDAPKEVLLGDAPKEVLLGDAPKEVSFGAARAGIPLPRLRGRVEGGGNMLGKSHWIPVSPKGTSFGARRYDGRLELLK